MIIMCKFRHAACDAYCYIAKQYDFCKDEENCPVFKLQVEINELKKENGRLRSICDYNCPSHKLVTHNICLSCSAVRNSPYHDLKNATDEDLKKIIHEVEENI